MNAPHHDEALVEAILLASCECGGLICARKLAADQGRRADEVVSAIAHLDEAGILSASASEIDGLIRVKWGAAAIRAVFWFCLNRSAIEIGTTGPARCAP